jgi:hypothetical protein
MKNQTMRKENLQINSRSTALRHGPPTSSKPSTSE